MILLRCQVRTCGSEKDLQNKHDGRLIRCLAANDTGKEERGAGRLSGYHNTIIMHNYSGHRRLITRKLNDLDENESVPARSTSISFLCWPGLAIPRWYDTV